MPKTTDKDLNMGNLNEKNTDFSKTPSRTGTGTTDTGTKHEPDISRRPTEDYKGSTGNISEDLGEGSKGDTSPGRTGLESDVEREGMGGSEYEQ